jgi:hypothetical protein
MAKLYSKKMVAETKMLPKKETIRLILQYSAALNIIKVGNLKFENITN